MTKQEFTERLRKGLKGLPQNDIEERIAFYSEMIDDRMEEGLSEEDAIAKTGTPEALASAIRAEIPLTRLVKERMTPKHKLAAWEIILLVLGSPLWLSLLIAAFAVILALYLALWSVILAFWAVFGALLVSALAGIAACVVYCCRARIPMGLATLGASMVCAGLSVLFFFLCRAMTRGICKLTRRIFVGNKKAKKEEA